MKRLLIADDEEPCLNLVRELLSGDSDLELTTARDGAEAWWLLTAPERHYDLGIFDLRMPLVDGLNLIARIRSVATLQRLPVVLCTGVSDRETVAQAARLGINGYVVKPYKPAAFLDKVRSLLSAAN